MRTDLAQFREGPLSNQPSSRPEVAVIEDNAFILEAWIDVLQDDAVVHAFATPEDLAGAMLDDLALLGRLSCVITDYYFDDSPIDGVKLGQTLKAQRPELTVLLCSDGFFSATDTVGIDRIIAKDPLSFAALPLRVRKTV